jgi:hypothetical protein
LRLPRDGGLTVLAGPHREEESAADEISGVSVGGARDEAAISSPVGEMDEGSKELRGYCPLTFRGGVSSCVSPEERSDGGEQLVAPLDVKGTPFEIVPKRRSHMACGILDSV